MEDAISTIDESEIVSIINDSFFEYLKMKKMTSVLDTETDKIPEISLGSRFTQDDLLKMKVKDISQLLKLRKIVIPKNMKKKIDLVNLFLNS